MPPALRAGLRATVTIAALCALAASDACAQAPRQVGWLMSGPPAAWANRLEALRAGLRDLGWVEGKTIALVIHSADTPEGLPDAAAEMVRRKVDVIFATSSTETEAARRATRTIPIVFATHADPEGVGHVASLARPGGNITGLSMLLTEIVSKELELVTQALPHAKRVGVVLTVTAPSHRPAWEALERTARRLGVEPVRVPVRAPEELDGALAALARERVGAFIAVASPLTRVHRALLGDLARKHHLAGMFGTRENVEAGGLMSYAPDLIEMTRRAAVYIDRILKGAKPADLPVERASKYELVVNLRTARALGLTIPPALLGRADHVIE